ncbi:MAG TPA: hypothetical protein PKM25_16950, partial [Candidatus Ozemobacteraceae bacterium]|nr:hypothetical protein [Candidatus Ozemobacteraceae bacterium]
MTRHVFWLVSLFALFAGTGAAEPIALSPFQKITDEISSLTTELSRADAMPDERLSISAGRLHGIDRVDTGSETFVMIDLSWVMPNLEIIRSEPDQRRRRQMLLQWRDTLRLLNADVVALPRPDQATRLEM